MNRVEKTEQALKKIDELTDFLDIPENDKRPLLSPSHSYIAVQIRRLIRDALVLPRRNCDVGTADEQAERFRIFCRNHQFVSGDSEDDFPPVYVCSNESCPLHDYYIAHGEDNCELAWAQMPYDEKEGEKHE